MPSPPASISPLAVAADTSLRPDNERYHITGLLGRGGMAIVYAATDRRDGRQVALKQLQTLADPIKQQRHMALFELEFHTLAQLAHPRIVRRALDLLLLDADELQRTINNPGSDAPHWTKCRMAGSRPLGRRSNTASHWIVPHSIASDCCAISTG